MRSADNSVLHSAAANPPNNERRHGAFSIRSVGGTSIDEGQVMVTFFSDLANSVVCQCATWGRNARAAMSVIAPRGSTGPGSPLWAVSSGSQGAGSVAGLQRRPLGASGGWPGASAGHAAASALLWGSPPCTLPIVCWRAKTSARYDGLASGSGARRTVHAREDIHDGLIGSASHADPPRDAATGGSGTRITGCEQLAGKHPPVGAGDHPPARVAQHDRAGGLVQDRQ